MVGFASTLGTTSLSIPDIPCFAPTVASQATLLALVLGIMRGNSVWTGRVGVGMHLGLHLGFCRYRRCTCTWPSQTMKNQREHAKRRRRSHPSSSSSRGVAHLRPTNSPTLRRMWTHRIIHAIERPFYICVYFCFCIPINDGDIGMSTGSYIGSSASFFMGLRTSRDVGEGEGKVSFESSLSGSSLESIVSHHSSQPEPPPQVEQPQPQPTKDEPIDTYTRYLPLILQHERLPQRLQVLAPLVGFEWGC